MDGKEYTVEKALESKKSNIINPVGHSLITSE